MANRRKEGNEIVHLLESGRFDAFKKWRVSDLKENKFVVRFVYPAGDKKWHARMCYYNTEQDAENTYGKLAEMAQKVKQEALVVGAEVSVLPAEGTPKPKQEASTAADIQNESAPVKRESVPVKHESAPPGQVILGLPTLREVVEQMALQNEWKEEDLDTSLTQEEKQQLRDWAEVQVIVEKVRSLKQRADRLENEVKRLNEEKKKWRAGVKAMLQVLKERENAVTQLQEHIRDLGFEPVDLPAYSVEIILNEEV